MPPLERPPYLPGRQAYPQVGIEDVNWLGPDGELDFADDLKLSGYEPESPLRLIIRAVIAADRDPNLAPTAWAGIALAREEAALAALIGGPGPGRREADDYDLLLEVARKFLAAFWADDAPRGSMIKEKLWEPSLARIIKTVIPDDHPLIRQRGVDGPEGLRKLLERKFRKQKDLLLARASSDFNDDRLGRHRKVKAALKALEELGIASDPSALPKPRLRDENTPI